MMDYTLAPTAVVHRNGRVLLARRPAGKAFGGCWETPGGKAEAGESAVEALTRELLEELGVSAVIGELLCEVFLDPPVVPRGYRIPAFAVEIEGEPHALASDEVRWFLLDDIAGLDLTPATATILDANRETVRIAIEAATHRRALRRLTSQEIARHFAASLIERQLVRANVEESLAGTRSILLPTFGENAPPVVGAWLGQATAKERTELAEETARLAESLRLRAPTTRWLTYNVLDCHDNQYHVEYVGLAYGVEDGRGRLVCLGRPGYCGTLSINTADVVKKDVSGIEMEIQLFRTSIYVLDVGQVAQLHRTGRLRAGGYLFVMLPVSW